MPELPEVETIVRKLNAGLPIERGQPDYPPLPGCTITAVRADWPPQIYPSVRALRRHLPGSQIETLTRRGKYLVFKLAAEAGYMLIHLKMSGRLDVLPAGWSRNKHDHVIWTLDNGYELRFNDTRKFGRVWWVHDPQTVLGALGPEPLEAAFTRRAFRALAARRTGTLKPTLLDQTFIAGIGNIYADESLWRAKLHPSRKLDSLTPAEIDALHRSIRAALTAGIKYGGASIDWTFPGGHYQDYFRAYGRAGQPCRRCGTAIERMTPGQRGTHFCPHCQVLS